MFALATSTVASPNHELRLKRGLSRLGRGFSSRCRRSSADLRGGGGEGGLNVGFVFGDLPRSMLRGRAGLLKGFPVTGEVTGLTTSSGFKRLWLLAAMCRDLPLGGECGGSTVSSGASRTGRGVSGGGGKALRAGDRMAPFSFTGMARPGFFGIGGGCSFATTAVVGSRVFSGGGPGEAFRLGGWAGWAVGAAGWSLPIFSKCDRREDTGFC